MEIVRHPEVLSSQMPTGPQVAQSMMEGLLQAVQDDPELQEVVTKGAMAGAQPVLLNADPPLHRASAASWRARSAPSGSLGWRRASARSLMHSSTSSPVTNTWNWSSSLP